MKQIYSIFFNPGEVVEIRALGVNGKSPAWDGFARGNGIVSGYFDNAEDFGRAAAALDKVKTGGIYFTPNPCNPACLARAQNRLVVADNKHPTTGNAHIDIIRWLLIDLDPKRLPGISSTKEELADARNTGKKIINLLEKKLNFPTCVRGLSGNGYHICCRLPDLPNTDEISGSGGLVHTCLLALAKKFTHDKVDIDLKVFNAARIWKLYGTMARKGDNTKDRPHRRSFLFKDHPTKLDEIKICDINQIKALAALAPAAPVIPQNKSQNKAAGPVQTSNQELGWPPDIAAYLSHYGYMLQQTKKKGNSTFFVLKECLFDNTHGDAAAIVVPDSPGPLLYTCFHNSCAGKTWKDARLLISGVESFARWFPGYDDKWTQQKKAREKAVADAANKERAWLIDANIQPTKLLSGSQSVSAPPETIDPMTFFDSGDGVSGRKRPTFKEAYLARYLAMFLSPVVSTAGQIWRYTHGVWSRFSDEMLEQLITLAMKNEIKASILKNIPDVFKSMINREEEDWPIYEILVNCKNGMLNLRTFTMLPHDPKYGSRCQVPCKFDKSVKFPRWEAFIPEIFPGQPEKGIFLQQFLGYCFVPTAKYERGLFLYGNGANGKSKVLNVLTAMLGDDNVSHVPLAGLEKPFNIPYLQGKMANIVFEEMGGSGEPAGASVLKAAISGDTLEGEYKYGKRLSFKPTLKFMFAMNAAPPIQDKTGGFERKIVLLKFPRKFKEHERDPDLEYKLMQELDGIFTWAMEGARQLFRVGGFFLQESIKKDTEYFMGQISPLRDFLKENVEYSEGKAVKSQFLYDEYRAWSKNAGLRPLGRPRFYVLVEDQYENVQRTRASFAGHQARVFMNLAIKEDAEINSI